MSLLSLQDAFVLIEKGNQPKPAWKLTARENTIEMALDSVPLLLL